MPTENARLADAFGALAVKIVPGVLGSIIALRGMPAESTWGQRLSAVAGGVAAAYYLSPAIYEWTGMASRNIEGALSFLVGAFAMVVIGEATETIREVQLAAIARDALRKLLRIDRG